LYVTSWGQHILPGTSSLVAVVSPPAPLAPADGGGDGGDGGGSDSESPDSVSTTTTIAEVLGARAGIAAPTIASSREVGVVVQKSGTRYQIAVTSPTRNSSIVVKATARGKQTITWSTKTNMNAQKFLFSTRSLQGYNIALWVNGRKLSSVKAG
jgi:hypothetical protein